MRIRRFSPVSCCYHTRFVDCSEADYARYMRGGVSIHRAFPHLSPADKDFIRYGILPDEWDASLDEMWGIFCEGDAKYDSSARAMTM